jgi:hypothetical protein
LSSDALQTPSIVCKYLKRPIITFVAIDPELFFVIDGETHTAVQDLIDHNTGKYNAIPFGLSFATPTYGNGSTINNTVTVLVNQMVKQNIL